MLVIALQFYRGDWFKAMKLARLLADLEVQKREDVVLMLVHTEDTSDVTAVRDVVHYCSRSFRVEDHVIRPSATDVRELWSRQGKWPWGCNLVWAGAARHFHLHMGASDDDDLLTLDGGDGVPLHREWIDYVREDHEKTVAIGRTVTGCVFPDSMGRWHVNGNLLLRRSLLGRRPELMELPPLDAGTEAGWDCYHRKILLGECRASSVIRADWRRVGVKRDHLEEVALSSVWWHGPKDGHFVDLARARLSSDSRRPVLIDRGLADELVRGDSR